MAKRKKKLKNCKAAELDKLIPKMWGYSLLLDLLRPSWLEGFGLAEKRRHGKMEMRYGKKLIREKEDLQFYIERVKQYYATLLCRTNVD